MEDNSLTAWGRLAVSTERDSTADGTGAEPFAVQWSLYVPPVVTVCTAQWSLCVPHSGQYLYRTVVSICTAQWSLYAPHSGHYMYRTVVTICTAQ